MSWFKSFKDLFGQAKKKTQAKSSILFLPVFECRVPQRRFALRQNTPGCSIVAAMPFGIAGREVGLFDST
jgi:hypothetical protein